MLSVALTNKWAYISVALTKGGAERCIGFVACSYAGIRGDLKEERRLFYESEIAKLVVSKKTNFEGRRWCYNPDEIVGLVYAECLSAY